jgi:hypothetical protein
VHLHSLQRPPPCQQGFPAQHAQPSDPPGCCAALRCGPCGGSTLQALSDGCGLACSRHVSAEHLYRCHCHQHGMKIWHAGNVRCMISSVSRNRHCCIRLAGVTLTAAATQAVKRQLQKSAHRLATASSCVAQMYLGFAPRRLGGGPSPPLPPELCCQSSAAASSTADSDHVTKLQYCNWCAAVCCSALGSNRPCSQAVLNQHPRSPKEH